MRDVHVQPPRCLGSNPLANEFGIELKNGSKVIVNIILPTIIELLFNLVVVCKGGGFPEYPLNFQS